VRRRRPIGNARPVSRGRSRREPRVDLLDLPLRLRDFLLRQAARLDRVLQMLARFGVLSLAIGDMKKNLLGLAALVGAQPVQSQ